MQISSIVDIVGGKLVKSPSISFITQIHTNPLKINEGDLFIASSSQDINTAVLNGAFAILFDFDVDITDKEIAWIKIKDTNIALAKLLRFVLSNKTIKSFYCDDISFEFLNIFSLQKNKNIFFLSGNIKEDFELLKDTENNQTIFCLNKKYMLNIQPLSQKFVIKKYNIQNLTVHSLFNTTFSYDGNFFYRLKLSSMYIDYFLSAYQFLKNDIDLNKLKNFKYFSPIFINKNFEIVDFGKSNKFILANDNINLIDKEIDFLNLKYGYAKVIIIKNFKNDKDLFKQILQLDFNALYVIGKTQEEIKDILNNHQKNSMTLL